MRDRRMAGHRLDREPLGDKAPNLLQSDDLFELDPVAESAAGGDDRIDQLQPSQLHFHVGFHEGAMSLAARLRRLNYGWSGAFLIASFRIRPTDADG